MQSVLLRLVMSNIFCTFLAIKYDKSFQCINKNKVKIKAKKLLIDDTGAELTPNPK